MELRRVADIDFGPLVGRTFHPSPVAWEDEVLYFLLLDRFSDGRERDYRDNAGEPVTTGETPLLRPEDRGNAVATEADAARWRAAGAGWCGGTLRGLRSKLGYLKRLGVTAVWISPVLKQVPFEETYHGYATQNFLDIDRHYGTPEDLRDTVAAAHDLGIRVVLDVVFNHAGNVFAYVDGGDWIGRPFEVAGFRDAAGRPSLPFGERLDEGTTGGAWPDGAVWPAELQEPGVFSCGGRIVNWDAYPEYADGDFFDLKDIRLGSGPPDRYRPSPALRALTRAYQYWIAYADLDGLRVDTVKHMDRGAARFFASAIHEFAESIGKENFYLIAEITGDRRFAFETLEQVGMDAALGLAEIQDQLEWLVKGQRDPAGYFGLFRDSFQLGKDSHTWLRNRVVTGYDDHDQVRKGPQKARFAADDIGQRMAVAAIALTATTIGIPCIYYGSEQRFDGVGGNDRYLREAMFGGPFGPFCSAGRHAFDETNPVYREVSRILAVRQAIPALRRGRQYLREISGDGVSFGLPAPIGGPLRSIVPWSRVFADHEVVAAINTDPLLPRTAWVTVDAGLHADGATLTCRYSTDPAQEGLTTMVERRNGRAFRMTVPAAGFVVYE
jgi:glycosidase